MASSSHESSESLTGLELVVYVPPKKEQPVVISLTRATHSKKKLKSQIPEDTERVSDEISFKLPKGCLKDVAIMEEQEGLKRKVYWSRPINFKLPEDSVDFVLRMDEKAQVIPDVEHLSLSERLEGWTVEKRQRDSSERYDKYFYHKKSNGKFRSFIEVETYIIHGRFPQRPQQHKVHKPKESPLALPWLSESSQTTSFKRKRSPRSFGITKKQKRMVEKFLENAWNNLLNSGQKKEDVHSSTSDNEPKVKEVLSESHNNLFNNVDTNNDEKITTPDDCDEEANQMITELLDVDGNTLMLLNEEPKPPQDNQVEKREKRTQVQGDGIIISPSENVAPDNEEPAISDIFLSHISGFNEYVIIEDKSAPAL